MASRESILVLSAVVGEGVYFTVVNNFIARGMRRISTITMRPWVQLTIAGGLVGASRVTHPKQDSCAEFKRIARDIACCLFAKLSTS